MATPDLRFQITELPNGRKLASWPHETTIWHWPDGSLAAARTKITEATITPASDEDAARGVKFYINEHSSEPVDVSPADLADIMDGGIDMACDLAAKATLIESLERNLDAKTEECALLGKQIATLTAAVDTQVAGIGEIEARFEREKERFEGISRTANETSAGLAKQLDLAQAAIAALIAENEELIGEGKAAA